MRANGKMESVTALVWKPEDVGFTVASGRRVLRVVTVSGTQRPRPPNTRAHGRAACKMDTDPKLTLTAVSWSEYNYL